MARLGLTSHSRLQRCVLVAVARVKAFFRLANVWGTVEKVSREQKNNRNVVYYRLQPVLSLWPLAIVVL